MLTKMTVKNQLTIPKKIIGRLGFKFIKEEDRYFDVEIKEEGILLRPVTISIEERIAPSQWQKFEDWATKKEKGDKIFTSSSKATEFLRKRIKKK